ncbi:hypothetical protein OROHE_016112 [Orobanche hederae]
MYEQSEGTMDDLKNPYPASGGAIDDLRKPAAKWASFSVLCVLVLLISKYTWLMWMILIESTPR